MTGTPASNPQGKIPLGHYELPDNTFEHDLAVLDRYQSFSAELLRLALLGIAAIGFLITNVVFKTPSSVATQINPSKELPSIFKCLVFGSLVCLGLSAACALLHRYVSADSIAYHLQSLRLDLRQASGDSELAEKQRKGRQWHFRRIGKLLAASAVLLWLGAVLVAISFVVAL